METQSSANPTRAQRNRTAQESMPSGPGAAAVLAAGIGSLTLGVFAFAGDASPPIGRAFNIWNPSGPLSGVTTGTIVVWLVAWYLLGKRWAGRDVGLKWVAVVALAMLACGLLLTFPPFADMLQGR